MKTLIENYNNLYSTEAAYFQNAFKMAGCDTHSWDTNIYSAYDAIDMIKPDVLIFKWNCQRKDDIINYIYNNDNAPDLAINLTGAPKLAVNQLKELKNGKVYFTNNYFESNYDIKKTHLIMPGADLFIPLVGIPNYTIDAAICYEQIGSQKFEYDSYHKLHFGTFNDNDCDLNVTLINLASIYNRYKQFILVGGIDFIFSQIFFDANLRANKVIIKNQEEYNDDVKYVLNQIFSLDQNENIENQIKTQIKTQHTCLNRTQQLLSLLNNTNAANNLNNHINKL
jgi:hypothetical protein